MKIARAPDQFRVGELEAQREAIARGRAAAREGREVSNEAVAGWLDSWFTPNEEPRPECEKPSTK